MYELKQVTKRCYTIQSPAKIGLIRTGETDVCLIDSGNDKDAGRKIRQILDSNGWSLKAVFNTHSNADHIGGNQYLQTQTGCSIYAPGIERDFTAHPLLEPSFLYGGFPPKDLRHKFLMAQSSRAEELTDDVLPEGVRRVPLPGHFFDMTGFTSDDGAIYLADSLSSRETLEKYQITFIYDVAAYLATLEMIKTLEAEVFIPAHAEETGDIAPLAQVNIDKVYEISEKIQAFCNEPVTFETLLQKLFNHYGLGMNFSQHVLIGSTVRSYLAWLKNEGRIEFEFTNGLMFWRGVNH